MGRTMQQKRKVKTSGMESNFDQSNDPTRQGTNGPRNAKDLYTKLLVVCRADVDRDTILNKIQESLGHSVKFFNCTTYPHRSIQGFNLHTFYVIGQQLAQSMCVLDCLGPTSDISLAKHSGNPPQAKVHDDNVKDKLRPEVVSRFKNDTGHLDLSNFAETNSLIRDYFFPINKFEIRSAIDDIILTNLNCANIKSVDLSHNRMTNFSGFTFLTKYNDIRILHVNDNEFGNPSVFSSIQSGSMTELTVKNNFFNTESDGRPSPPIKYIPELLKIFPNLVTLDYRPISQFSLDNSLDLSSDDPEPLCKISKVDTVSSSSAAAFSMPSSSTLPSSAIKIEPSQPNDTPNISRHQQSDRLTENSSSSQVRRDQQPDTQGKNNNNDNTTDSTVTCLEQRFAILENQLADSTSKITMLTTVINGLSEFKKTADTDLKKLQDENDWLKEEIARMRQQQLQSNGVVQKLKEQHFHNGVEIQKLRDQQQHSNAEIMRMRDQLQRSRNMNGGPSQISSSSSYVPTRPLAETALPQQPRSYDHYNPPQITQRQPPAQPSSATTSAVLEDMSHLFDRPRRR